MALGVDWGNIATQGIAGIGNYFAGQDQTSAFNKAANMDSASAQMLQQQGPGYAMTGFNYLNGNPTQTQFVNNAGSANDAQAQLLGLKPVTSATQNGFQNYLNSTGYNFQLGQGINAINSSAAAKGALNSGGTLKALDTYGQGMAGQYFNNYLGQLGGMSATGQTALGQTGAAGTAGGTGAVNALANAANAQANAASATASAGQAQSKSDGGLWGSIAKIGGALIGGLL